MKLRIGTVLSLLLAASPSLAQEGPDHARLRWEWFYRQRAFPFADIAPGSLERARQQLGSLRVSLRILGAPPVGGTRWESIGPFSINGTAIGRISTVAVHPTNGNVIYIGGAQGGVWKTTDRGSTWTPLTDKQCSLAMGSIVIDPVNPEIVYAGTGEQHFSGDSYYGCGVLRSTDGGQTWTQLAPIALRVRTSRVVLLPSTAGNTASTTILVASDNGLFRSTNGGTTWTTVRAGVHTDLLVDPSNDQILYAGFRNNAGGGTGGVLKSVNGGLTWITASTGLPATNKGRINIAIAPSAPSTLFASVQNQENGSLLGIFKSTDAGNSWTQLNAGGASCGTQCWYDMFVTVHPTDPNIVFFGGIGLFRSTNGGASFSSVGGQIHVDQHFLTFDPQNPLRAYVANDGGIYRSDNGGVTWTGINTGLAITQFYGGISLHPSTTLQVIGGTQDNGTLAFSGAPTWNSILGGDGGFTAISHDNANVRFGETQWTPNSGFSGPNRSDGGGFMRKVNGINLSESAQFIPPLVMDPGDSRVLYFGTTRLYRTSDAADNWFAISSDFGATLTAIAPAPSNPSTVYVGTANGQVHVTTNTGETWTLITAGLPTRTPTDVAVDRADSRTAYASFSGFGTGHLFRTVNGGQTWTNVSGNLPDIPVNAVVLDPASRAFVMIGTDLGVFVSGDSGTTWTVLDNGMPNVAVYDIAYNAATGALVAATHGRGMFQLQLDRALTLAAVPRKRRVNVPENSGGQITDSAAVVLSGTGGGIASWTATHSASAPWVTLTTIAGTGSGTVRWTRNPAGRAPGVHVDTITITSPGAVDSPAQIIDTLVVEPIVPSMSVSNEAHADTMSAIASETSADSALITFVGAAGAQVTWSAVARRGTWLTVATASGTGTGHVRWMRNSSQLPAGINVDTIVITAPGASGSPAIVIDTLVVQPALVASKLKRDTLVSGSNATSVSNVQLTIAGDPGGSINWTAIHGAGTWITLSSTSGRGAATLTWTKTASNLRDGVFIDTITVTAPNAPTLRIIDTLTVIAPVTNRACVTDHLLGLACLDATQLTWLDLAGNRDGAYNLGDLLAYLARPAAAPSVAPQRRRKP